MIPIDHDAHPKAYLYVPAGKPQASRFDMRQKTHRAKMRNVWASNAIHGERATDRADRVALWTVFGMIAAGAIAFGLALWIR